MVNPSRLSYVLYTLGNGKNPHNILLSSAPSEVFPAKYLPLNFMKHKQP